MGFFTILFFMTLVEAAVAAYIYNVYHYVVFPDLTKGSMARLVLCLLPFNIALIFTVDALSDSLSGLYRGTGGQGRNQYSKERGLARQGDRDAACDRLAKAVSRRGDIEALRLMVEIATDEPRLHLQISKAAGLRGKLKNATKEDLAGLDMMMGRTVRVEKKEEPAFF